MVIDNFQVCCVSGLKAKTDAELVVDANGILAGPVAGEFFETVSGRKAKIVHGLRGLNQTNFSQGRLLQRRRQFLVAPISKKRLGLLAGEAFDHESAT